MTTAGIDTSKGKLDIAVHGRAEQWQVANTLPGWRILTNKLTKAGVSRVGIEATGGYECGAVQYLRAAGFTVQVLQPVQVKAFGRMHLRRAKNDALDAVMIAACTAALDQVRDAPDPRLAELAEQLTFLEQIEEDIKRFKTRLEHTSEPRLRRMVLGEITALAILIRMPELGRISREEAAALAGLAPFDNDSGQQKGQRRIAGGRARLRRSLYAAALPAAFRWNRALIALYQRLIAAGKAHNAALIACARKLLIYANTVVQRGTPWTERPVAI
jgi:transposase